MLQDPGSADLLRCDDPVQAEWWASSFLHIWRRTLRPFAPALAELGIDGERELAQMLVDAMITPGDLAGAAALLALDAIAPPPLRNITRPACETLTTAGARVPGWASTVGQSSFRSGWAYRSDPTGQSVLGAVFECPGRRPHALVVLVDYGLGGAIKNVMLTDHCDETESRWRRSADDDGVDFETLVQLEVAIELDLALQATARLAELPLIDPDVWDLMALLEARVQAMHSSTAAADPVTVG